MKKIAIISSSVRDGRLSHRVALFLQKYAAERLGVETDLLDLREYDFPIFHERYANLAEKPAGLEDFAERFKAADGILIVSPVYNASYPAALKNAIDVFVKEWVQKPSLVVSVTYGTTPGIATVQKLQNLLMKLGARVAAPVYTVLQAGVDFDEDGTPHDPERIQKYAAAPLDELKWLVDKTAGDAER